MSAATCSENETSIRLGGSRRSPVEICASDAGTTVGEILALNSASHQRIQYLGLRQNSHPLWVLKRARSAKATGWSPKREYQGLAFVAGCMAGAHGFSSIAPLGFNDEEQWLLMRYQSGESVRLIVDRAIHGIIGQGMDRAEELLKRLAHWLLRFRESSVAPVHDHRAVHYQYCADRLDEIDKATVGVGRLSRRNVKHLVAELVERVGGEAETLFPTHGDMATQNFVLTESGSLCPMDLEGFAFKPLDDDFTLLRFRFESDALLHFWGRRRASSLWRKFCETYIEPERDAFTLLAYLHKLLGDLSWMARRSGTNRSFVQAVRTKLRIRDRLKWLTKLPASPAQAFEYLRNRL